MSGVGGGCGVTPGMAWSSSRQEKPGLSCICTWNSQGSMFRSEGCDASESRVGTWCDTTGLCPGGS